VVAFANVHRLKWLYWLGAALLAPWIVYLYFSQHQRALTHEVHVMVVGLILAMLITILTTAWLYQRDSPMAVVLASTAASITFISAWFRTLTRDGVSHWAESILTFTVVAAVIIVLCGLVIGRELHDASHASPPARWLQAALVVIALALVPSLVISVLVVPEIQVAHRLKIAWTGLDIFELLALATTGFALHFRSRVAIVSAAVTGALLVCDAWINVVPSNGAARIEGIVLAFVELPLAAVSYWVAVKVAQELLATSVVHPDF
jgi:hypothetical protein